MKLVDVNYAQFFSVSRLKIDLDERINFESLNIISPTLRGGKLVPTNLQMLNKPLKLPQEPADEHHLEWSNDGQYRRGEDFKKLYKHPPGNITHNEMFNRIATDHENQRDETTPGPNVAAVVGQPGIGKTTCLKSWGGQIVEKQILENASLVFLIFVRGIRFTHKQNLLQFLLSSVYADRPSYPGSDDAIVQRIVDDENVIILIDGLDEAAVDNIYLKACDVHPCNVAYPLHFLLNLVGGKLLPRAKVVVSSRPDQLYRLHPSHRPEFIVQILGLNEDGRDDIGTQLCPQRYEEVKQMLLQNPDVLDYCYVPTQFILTVDYLLQHDSEKEFISLSKVFAHACNAYARSASSDQLRERDLSRMGLELDKLGMLAWNGCSNRHVTFKTENFEEVGLSRESIESFLNTSVLENVDLKCRILASDKRSYFSHLLWQEFFAALYLMMVMNMQDFETFAKRLRQDHWQVVLKLAFGFSGSDTFSVLQPLILACKEGEVKRHCEEKTKWLQRFAIQQCRSSSLGSNTLFPVSSWVRESSNEAIAREVAANLPQTINFEKDAAILPSDISSLFHLLKYSKSPHELHVRDCTFAGDSWNRFTKEIEVSGIKVRPISYVCF